jgi:adenine-specific DNA-methyltransferase
MILDTLRVAGVQQAHKEDRITFESLDGWPGTYIAGKGAYRDADGSLKTAGIFIGPEFGTVSRVGLVDAARECADVGLDVLISCAFNYEAQSTEFDKLGPLPVLKARMNADLHMQQDLANSGKGNLFVIFGEPDIDILDTPDDQIQVKINGVDVFDPSTGEVRSDEPDNIACWFIDSDYNGESFFVRQAYFLGQNDPYKSLKTSLKAEIDALAASQSARAKALEDKEAQVKILTKEVADRHAYLNKHLAELEAVPPADAKAAEEDGGLDGGGAGACSAAQPAH